MPQRQWSFSYYQGRIINHAFAPSSCHAKVGPPFVVFLVAVVNSRGINFVILIKAYWSVLFCFFTPHQKSHSKYRLRILSTKLPEIELCIPATVNEYSKTMNLWWNWSICFQMPYNGPFVFDSALTYKGSQCSASCLMICSSRDLERWLMAGNLCVVSSFRNSYFSYCELKAATHSALWIQCFDPGEVSQCKFSNAEPTFSHPPKYPFDLSVDYMSVRKQKTLCWLCSQSCCFII